MASPNQGPRHVGQWLYLRAECIDEYKKCHAAVWPEVLEQIKDSNVRDCTFIFHFYYHVSYDPNKTDNLHAQLQIGHAEDRHTLSIRWY